MVRLLTVQASSDPRTPINSRGIMLPHLNSSPRKQRQGMTQSKLASQTGNISESEFD